MEMTLRSFIEMGGVPASEAYSSGSGPFANHMRSSVRTGALLNRGIQTSYFNRIARAFLYRLDLGHIRLERNVEAHAYWCYDRNRFPIELQSLKYLNDKQFKYVDQLYIGFSDDTFDELKENIIPKSVQRIFCHNSNVISPRVSWLPLGRDPFGSAAYKVPPKLERHGLVLANFSKATHPVRAMLAKQIAGREFIVDEVLDGYGRYVGYRYSPEQFYAHLSGFKFCICPRGNGIDTYRTWDALHLGVIPIVVSEANFHNEMRDLPILFIKSYEDYKFLNRSYLEQCFDEMLNKSFNFGKLTSKYWLERMFGSAIL